MSEFRRKIMMFTRPILTPISVVPEPTISPASGSIFASQTISISISGIAVSAEYSTDNTNWITYTSPFAIASDTTIYARALDVDGNYSNVVSSSYIILPYDAQVEYLQSSGTQYIQFPLAVNKSSVFAVGFNFIPVYINNNKYTILGANPHAQFNTAFYSYNSSTQTITYGSQIGNSGTSGGYTGIVGTSKDIELSTLGKTQDGVFTPLSRPLTANITHFCIFGRYNNSSRYPLKICSLYISVDSIKIRDFIPVRVGQVGYMYDKVSGNLFGNSGTGSFTLGNDVIN